MLSALEGKFSVCLGGNANAMRFGRGILGAIELREESTGASGDIGRGGGGGGAASASFLEFFFIFDLHFDFSWPS